MREIRRRLRLDRIQLSQLIGFTGTSRNDGRRVKIYENSPLVPLYIARLVWLIDVWSRRYGVLPPFPEWPGYELLRSDDPQHRHNEKKEEPDGAEFY